MLLGIYGMHALGKTTFMRNHQDEWANVALDAGHDKIVTVVADQGYEYMTTSDMDIWQMDKDETGRWNGKRADKEQHLVDMIKDRKTLWVVESARYFGGLHDLMIPTFQEAGGGIKFIIVYASPKAGRQFLIDRCTKTNKTFREDYWDEGRLEYECKGRYVNAMTNRFVPAGIECHSFKINYKRTAWEDVHAQILSLVDKKPQVWYNNKSEVSSCTSSKSVERMARGRPQL